MERPRRRWLRSLVIVAGAAVVVGLLYTAFVHGLLRATRGQWIAPIDDSYIHLQYAQAIADGRGLAYQLGDGYSGGATSPLWVLLLALFANALPSALLVPVLFALGAVCFGLAAAAIAAAAVSAREGGPLRSISVAAPAIGFLAGQGFLSWAAFSGMETMMFAALVLAALAALVRWRRALVAEGSEARLDGERDALSAPLAGGGTGTSSPRAAAPPPRSLLVVCALLPLARPDGVLVALAVVALVLWRGRLGKRALLSAFAVLAPAALALCAHRYAYGRWATAGLEMKAASYLPYVDGAAARQRTFEAALAAARRLFAGGRGFLPMWLSASFAALGLLALVRELRERRLGAAAVAWPLLLAFVWSGATVAVPQFRQDRYFVPALVVLALLGALGAGELGRLVAALLRRWRALGTRRPRLAMAIPLVLDLAIATAALVALWPTVRFWQRAFAGDAVAILRKQVAAARWLLENTPPDASVLVCDAGALALLSQRRVFDIVGLTARHGGNAYLSGAGSRFEEMEAAGPARWPTHAALYSWCGWPGASMQTLSTHADLVVSRFVEPGLGSAEAPLRPDLARRDLLDRLDLAELASERAHGFREADGGARERNVIGRHRFAGRPVVDGGRVVITSARFSLTDPGELTAGRALIVRTEPGATGSLIIAGVRHSLAGRSDDTGGFSELLFPVPDRAHGEIEVTVEAAAGAPLPLYSVWLLGAP